MKLDKIINLDTFQRMNDIDCIYQMCVYCFRSPKDNIFPEDEGYAYKPFVKNRVFRVEKSCVIFVKTLNQVSAEVDRIVNENENIYSIRIFRHPLNCEIRSSEEYDTPFCVLNAKGEVVYMEELDSMQNVAKGNDFLLNNSEWKEKITFKDGEIVEYHNIKFRVVELGVVCGISEKSDRTKIVFKYTGRNLKPDIVHKLCFPISDEISEELKKIYDEYKEYSKLGILSFSDLLDML